jgi:DNA polymerase-3 subunit epsilon
VKNPAKKYLRLEELFEVLFNSSLANQHNALADAIATAKCYFALVERGQIKPTADYRNDILTTRRTSNKVGCSPLIAFFLLTVLILWISL